MSASCFHAQAAAVAPTSTNGGFNARRTACTFSRGANPRKLHRSRISTSSASSSSSASTGDNATAQRQRDDEPTEDVIVEPSDAPADVIIDAQIRAERMAVRLKLQSVGATQRGNQQQQQQPAVVAKPTAAAAAGARTEVATTPLSSSVLSSFDEATLGSLDAAIVAAAGTAKLSARIEEERAAVRSRLQKFSIKQYAFVNAGANAGRVIDRVTGEAAPVTDDATRSIEDRVDLAQERVKQAQQEVQNVETLMEMKNMDLRRRWGCAASTP
jgi:hypothetical protein